LYTNEKDDLVGHIEVDNHGHIRDINTARTHVCRYEHLQTEPKKKTFTKTPSRENKDLQTRNKKRTNLLLPGPEGLESLLPF
jgi:hypothetical protein